MKKYSKKNIHSPVEKTLEVVGSKWAVLILCELMDGMRRYGEIEKALKGISPRTLSLRLASLEEQGIIERKVYPEVPPRVEYKLSVFGRSLKPILKTMHTWGVTFEKKSGKR